MAKVEVFDVDVQEVSFDEIGQALVLNEDKELTPYQQAKAETDAEIEHQMISLSAAFRALRKAAPKLVREIAEKAKTGSKMNFDKKLSHQILNEGKLGALIPTFDVVDKARVRWSRATIKSAFFRAVGVTDQRGWKATLATLEGWLDPDKLSRLTQEKFDAMEWFFDSKEKPFLQMQAYWDGHKSESRHMGAEGSTRLVEVEKQYREVAKRVAAAKK